MRINIAMAGGPCTGKSTTAAALFAHFKEKGFDYDLITEESRKLRKEFGSCRNTFDRFYLWRQQEREELRSCAADGFITDTCLFQYYVAARLHKQEERDNLAIRELFRMCLEVENRYKLIVMAENPLEIDYKTDQSRKGSQEQALKKHRLLLTFIQHHANEKLLLVTGNVQQRIRQIEKKLKKMRK